MFAKASSSNTDGSNLNICIGDETNHTSRVWVPAATPELSGIVSTDTQTFAGAKTFNEQITAKKGMQTNGIIAPMSSGAYSLGTSNLYWSNVYSTNLTLAAPAGSYAYKAFLKVYGKAPTASNIGGSFEFDVEQGSEYSTMINVNFRTNTDNNPLDDEITRGTITLGLDSDIGTYISANVLRGNLAASYITGTLGVTHGGTGTNAAPKAGGIIYGASTTAYGCSDVGEAGEVLTSGGANPPSWTGVSVANSSNTIVKRDAYGNFNAGTITATSFSGSGASLTTLNASNISSGTLSVDRLASSGVTANSYGPSADANPGLGKTFSVPYITVDKYGRITAASTKTITLPTYSNFSGATSGTAGVAGLVPAPTAGQQNYFLRGNGTWYNLTDLDGTALDTFSELKAAWESGDGTLNSTLTEAINKKVAKAGDTMTGNLTFSNEKKTLYKIERKQANAAGQGWAYVPISMIGNDDASFFNIGVFGNNNTLEYGYIGSNSQHNATNNFRIYKSGNIAFGDTSYLSIISPSNTANTTFYLPNTGGTLVTHPIRGTAVGDANNPVYIASTGVATQCNKYGGGTAVTLNNVSKAAGDATIYAPQNGGTANYYLRAVGSTSEPQWTSFKSLTINVKNIAGTTKSTITYNPLDEKSIDILPDNIFETYTLTESSKALTTGWSNTGWSGTSLASGSYIIQVKINDASAGLNHYNEIYTGIMSWYSGGTNDDDYDEIVLHKAGHASNNNNIYLRTCRRTNSTLVLQISASKSATTSYTLTARRLFS